MVMVNEGAGSFENPEPGSYAAVCNQVIDLGTQEGEYQGNKIKRRQVILGVGTDGEKFQGRAVSCEFILYRVTVREIKTSAHA
ncbi:MAG: hypothetical protein IPH01_11030 [Elusimicrobia bacterium]|nr:hypothetical protein [Elusimicrobiota bacterium]